MANMNNNFLNEIRNYIYVTDRCNNNCQTCSYINTSNKILSLEKLIKTRKNNISQIIFFGGEPTLNKKLHEFIVLSKKSGYKDVIIFTNARMFYYEKYTEKIINSGLTKAVIKVFSYDKNTHETLTNIKNSYDQTLEGINNLSKHPVHISLFITITKLNYKGLVNTILFYTCNFPGINQINISLTKANQENKKLIPKLSNIRPYLEKALEFSKNKNIDIQVEGIPLCFLNNYEDYSFEARHILHNEVEATEINPFFKIIEVNTLKNKKSKSDICKQCNLNSICFGVWDFYNEIYDLNELKPNENNLKDVKTKIKYYYTKLRPVIKKYY
ncbi:radical SAM protein [Candidatus Woesearchaeota archaeon]|nr:radical SAM protein [Candidatus Woesearchaeota archaeon]